MPILPTLSISTLLLIKMLAITTVESIRVKVAERMWEWLEFALLVMEFDLYKKSKRVIIIRLKILLPKRLPKAKSGAFIFITEATLTAASGKEVTTPKRIMPIQALLKPVLSLITSAYKESFVPAIMMIIALIKNCSQIKSIIFRGPFLFSIWLQYYNTCSLIIPGKTGTNNLITPAITKTQPTILFVITVITYWGWFLYLPYIIEPPNQPQNINFSSNN